MPVVVESLDREGRGIARVEGKAIFIDGGLPGETVSYSSYRKKPNYELASVTAIHEGGAASACVAAFSVVGRAEGWGRPAEGGWQGGGGDAEWAKAEPFTRGRGKT